MSTTNPNDRDRVQLGDLTYTVQIAETVADDDPNQRALWRDVATVKVAPRTKRPTIIAKGLEQAGIEVTPETQARALDASSAHIFRPQPPPPPPPLRFA